MSDNTLENKIYGPSFYKRNDDGLLAFVDYTFNEDGSIDWRSMIKPEFLYPNKDWFTCRNKDIPSSPEGLDDKQLLIMLGGIKELARLRGFQSVCFDTKKEGDGYVTAKCTIHWLPNYMDQNGCVYEDVANATLENTDSFCAKFLETIACNRAFVRCVRNFLNIHIVGADEIDKSKGANNSESVESVAMAPITPSGLLEKILREKHEIKDFNSFKDLLRNLWREEKYVNEDVKNWESFDKIPAKEARKLISILSK